MRTHQFHMVYQERLSKATKPFIARGAKVKRCTYCQVESSLCLCDIQPNIDSKAKFMLLVSDTEIFKPSNTGRLIADVVKDTQVHLWSRTEPASSLLMTLSDPNLYPVVVFPDEYVDNKERIISTHDLKHIPQGKTALFIVLDGSWREARRMFRRSPYLDSLPVLSIHPERISEYIMRKSSKEEHLSTAEVSSIVLREAGFINEGNVLESWFQVFRETYLLSKSRAKKDQSRPSLDAYLTKLKT
ncbi:tRNA-uridine aminocarboxypropyltransferase [Vibrio viridaestus]|uniref:tRNA-uridine aminocarboxypropyltransferase n=1 Tax=Vibrio viridaestus TaxID=2487322 RepID=A0A3N9U262_9VIBR|nr:tRNA-uridine aminocarboxypropyltransferase [Vibrio viridaestus]RQW63592.1 DTW domain-containing protein [Vibrio viridaestus]